MLGEPVPTLIKTLTHDLEGKQMAASHLPRRCVMDFDELAAGSGSSTSTPRTRAMVVRVSVRGLCSPFSMRVSVTLPIPAREDNSVFGQTGRLPILPKTATEIITRLPGLSLYLRTVGRIAVVAGEVPGDLGSITISRDQDHLIRRGQFQFLETAAFGDSGQVAE